GTKIIIGFICISLLLAFVGFVSDHFTNEIRQEQLRYVNEASEVVILTGEMERSLFQSLIFLNGVREAWGVEENYTNIQELPAVQELTTKFQEELLKFEASFQTLEALLEKDDNLPEDVSEFYNSYKLYKSITREWLNLGNEDLYKANLMFINSIEPYFRNNIIPEITQLRNFVLNIQDERNQRLIDALNRAAFVNNIATLSTVLIAIFLAVYIYRSIANPISKVSRTAKKLGDGKLDERIKVKSNDEIGELANAFNSMAANLQKKTVSKAYLDNIIESIQEALFVVDNDGILLFANSSAAKMVGYEMDELIKRPLNQIYDLEEMEDIYNKNKEKNRSFEFSLIHKNSKKIPVLFSESELTDNQGNQVGTVSVASDISERKQQEKEIRTSLKEKEVMLAEIHHRVKNNLALISGLLQLQSFSVDNKEVLKALSDSQTRIQSIALVHEMLYESESLAYIKYDKYVNDLLQAINSMHINIDKNILLSTNVEPISMTINQAIPCSLLLNELVVNAYKHAFAGKKNGKINIDLELSGENIVMTVSDNGTGFEISKFNNSDTLGVKLIKTLTNQLNGEFEIRGNSKETGSIFQVKFLHVL
ncbi:MAG: histidine kinase dimerization/phosphoacceptor domain -containing protein, partial [Gracilimonas sp.]